MRGSTHGSRQRDGSMNQKYKFVFAKTKCVNLTLISTYIDAIFIHRPYFDSGNDPSLCLEHFQRKNWVRSGEPTFCDFCVDAKVVLKSKLYATDVAN